MRVGSESTRNVKLRYRREGDAIGQAPIFVWALRIELPASLQQFFARRQNLNPSIFVAPR